MIPNQHLRRHFGAHGTILSFEPQIDKCGGCELGIVRITFSSHDEAKACVTKENGKKLAIALTVPCVNNEGEDLRVVFDGEGELLKAAMGELDRMRQPTLTATSRASQRPKYNSQPAEGLSNVNAALFMVLHLRHGKILLSLLTNVPMLTHAFFSHAPLPL